MKIDELRMNFTYLINGYVTDQVTKTRLLALVLRGDVPAKAILADLTPYLSGVVTEADAKIVKDIVFNFC